MKYFILLGDGMADEPIEKLDFKTPLMVAKKATIDKYAINSVVGMVNITPEGLKGGSDVGNLCALGYDARKYLTGRSPLEAASLGIEMTNTDIAIRCNLVTLSDDEKYEDKKMLDYSADEITTQEAEELINYINDNLGNDIYKFYSGISYRHCLINHNGKDNFICTPPHDISGKVIKEYLPKGDDSKIILEMMIKSHELLKNHPINKQRIKKGLKSANSIWLWGQGKKPMLPLFKDKYNKSGSMITAVDLLKGIANLSKMKIYEVEGATGNLETNFEGKALMALKALEENDFVYVHIEAADECGHRFEIENKVKAIEKLDYVLNIITKGLENKNEEYSFLFFPDHPTPLTTGTHDSSAVPFMLYRSNEKNHGVDNFCEVNAKNTNIYQNPGYELINRLFEK